MDLSALIKPIGIVTYCLLLLTFGTGIRIIKTKLWVHKLLSILTLVFATIHGFMVIYLNYF